MMFSGMSVSCKTRRTMYSMSFSIHANRIFTVINRDNSKGSALVHTTFNVLGGTAVDNRVLLGNTSIAALDSGS